MVGWGDNDCDDDDEDEGGDDDDEDEDEGGDGDGDDEEAGDVPTICGTSYHRTSQNHTSGGDPCRG